MIRSKISRKQPFSAYFRLTRPTRMVHACPLGDCPFMGPSPPQGCIFSLSIPDRGLVSDALDASGSCPLVINGILR